MSLLCRFMWVVLWTWSLTCLFIVNDSGLQWVCCGSDEGLFRRICVPFSRSSGLSRSLSASGLHNSWVFVDTDTAPLMVASETTINNHNHNKQQQQQQQQQLQQTATATATAAAAAATATATTATTTTRQSGEAPF